MSMYMLMLVLDDPQYLDDVLDAWDGIGVSGVTFIESSGINRRRMARQVGALFMEGINRLIGNEEESHYTLFVILPHEGVVQDCLEAVENIVGNLDGPNTGVMAAWPLAFVKGVPPEVKKQAKQ